METTVMKTNRFSSVLRSAMLSSAIATGLFASTGTAHAQNRSLFKANVPFAFEAGSKQMPAGLYEISSVSNDLLLLYDRDPGTHVTGIVMVSRSTSGKVQTHGRLVFHRYGNRYFLREAWEEGSNIDAKCPPSSAENEILRSESQRAQTLVAVDAEPKR
jgi:hypothetical protein